MEYKQNTLLELPTDILHVVAHPDDEAIYGGGLTALNQAIGGNSYVVCLGGADSENPHRKDEFQRSCDILGVHGTLFGLENGAYRSPESICRLSGLIGQYKPHFLLTHAPSDFHMDHHATRDISKQAAMNQSSRTKGHQLDALLYTEGYTPHMLSEVHSFIDVGPVTEKVLDALNVHTTQAGISHYENVMNARWALRGVHAGCEQAEAFYIDPLPVSTRSRVKDYSHQVGER